MTDYPQSLVSVDHVAPVPRRVRAMLGAEVVLDTTRARYVWEWPHYPQYYIPRADIAADLLVGGKAQPEQRHSRGVARRFGVRRGPVSRPESAWVYGEDAIDGLADTVRFDWHAMDRWFEEDEEVFVHPRGPYSRVDALRSTRRVRVELDGVLLAESSSPVLLFETGLPTRYYLNPTEVDLSHLEPSATVTGCPYKGRTTAYWTVRTGEATYPDLAWCYHFPVPTLPAIAGLVAFYNEKVDVTVDGRRLHRPVTPFSDR